MSGPRSLHRRRGRQAKKRHFRRLLFRRDREPDLRQGLHEGFPGRPRAFREAEQREHQEEMPALTQVLTVPPQHLVPALGRRDAVDHHAESSCCLPAGTRPGKVHVWSDGCEPSAAYGTNMSGVRSLLTLLSG